MAAGVVAGGIFGGSPSALAAKLIQLPFENGRRDLVRFPQKSEMILLRERPPLLETPFEVFDKVFTPNDQFFVRWHLPPVIPTSIDVDTFRLRVDGHVRNHTLNSRSAKFCINRRSSLPQWLFRQQSRLLVAAYRAASGAMVRWWQCFVDRVSLKSILDRVGVLPGAVQVRFSGLDTGEVPETPIFRKSLTIEHTMDGEVMVAYGMNGAQFPMINGFPLRLIVPGWYSTYWVKMLSHIEVLDKPDDNFWMRTAYLIPDTPGGTMASDAKDVKMVPINRMVPRSFITNLRDNATVRRSGGAGRSAAASPLAATPGSSVAFSSDGGTTWQNATLGKDYGRYSFRRWQTGFVPTKPGTHKLMNATSSNSRGPRLPAGTGVVICQRDRTDAVYTTHRRERPMSQTRKSMVLITLVIGLIAPAFTDAIALGQSAGTPIRHRTLDLTSQRSHLWQQDLRRKRRRGDNCQ